MATRIAVITVSDTRTAQDDASGSAVVESLRALGFEDFETAIVTDDRHAISGEILRMCETADIVFTTGGTGFSPRDVTPEATEPLLERRADNLSELIRAAGSKSTAFSYLSRGVAGVSASQRLIVNLPGSPNGARQSIEAIGHLLRPIVSQLTVGECPVEPC